MWSLSRELGNEGDDRSYQGREIAESGMGNLVKSPDLSLNVHPDPIPHSGFFCPLERNILLMKWLSISLAPSWLHIEEDFLPGFWNHSLIDWKSRVEFLSTYSTIKLLTPCLAYRPPPLLVASLSSLSFQSSDFIPRKNKDFSLNQTIRWGTLSLILYRLFGL